MIRSEAREGSSRRVAALQLRCARQWAVALCLAVGAWGWVAGAYGADITVSSPLEVAPGAPLDAKALTEQSGGLGLTGGARLGAESVRDQMAIILWDEAKRVRQPISPTPQSQGVIDAKIVR